MTAIEVFGNPPCRNLNDVMSTPAGISRLRMRLGWEGYGIYCALIDMLATYPSLSFPADYDLIAFKLGADAELIREVAEDFGLFCTEKNDLTEYLYSPALRNLNKRLLSLNGESSSASRESSPKRTERPRETESREAVKCNAAAHADKPSEAVMESPIANKGNFDLKENMTRLAADQGWLSRVAAFTGLEYEVMARVFKAFAAWRVSESAFYSSEEEMTRHLVNWIRRGYAASTIKTAKTELKARRDQERREAERAQARRRQEEHARSTITYADYCRSRGIESTGSFVADVMKRLEASRRQKAAGGAGTRQTT